MCRELRESRAGNVAALRERLERAVAEGDLPAKLDCEAMATFYATVQQGMSIQARDGASRATLLVGRRLRDGRLGRPDFAKAG